MNYSNGDESYSWHRQTPEALLLFILFHRTKATNQLAPLLTARRVTLRKVYAMKTSDERQKLCSNSSKQVRTCR